MEVGRGGTGGQAAGQQAQQAVGVAQPHRMVAQRRAVPQHLAQPRDGG